MRNMFNTFQVLFFLVATFVAVIFIMSGYLTYQCYTSGDRDSMACYLISEKADVIVRHK